jgi:uridine phosphorylase
MAKVTFPKIGEKHNFTPLIAAKHFMKRNMAPRKVILIYSSSNLPKKLRKFLKLHTYNRGVAETGAYKPHTYLTADRKLMIVKLPAGAVNTGMAVEEARAAGGREFLILGSAGALNRNLKISDIVLCTGAVRDEGTSHHYIAESKYAFPDRILTSKLERQMRRSKIRFYKGTSWTIDAPYAETKEEIKHYRKEGVLTVEMEASALFAVAKRRNAKAAAIFTVSDLLGKKWSGFREDYRESGYENLARIAKLFKDMR